MDLSAEKLKIIELLLRTSNPSIIRRIKSVFQTEETQDIWEELSIEQQQEINKALEEVKNGQTVSFESFMEKYK